MKLKDIQIDGFGVWTGLSVDSLPDGMTLFYGPNEAGKTTTMQFLRAMLYGFTPERRQRYLPPVHGGTPGGAIRVTGPGGGYQISRRAQLTDTGAAGQLAVTGSDGLSQGQHRLGSLLGQIDEAIFTNVFAIGLRELQELSTLDDTSAADELYKLSSGLDRVSLVDCMRSLRGARQSLVGKNQDVDGEAGRLANLLRRRQQLRDEVENLTRGGRRWSELAAQRRTQQQEIEQLTERVAQWEREARTVEVATSVREVWGERSELLAAIQKNEKGADLPDDAPSQLVQIEAQINERKAKLEEVKKKRRELRDKADALPLSRRMLDLQARIEAASQQIPWVEALQEQVQRLDGQIAKARGQVDADAEKLGMDQRDRQALAEGSRGGLPDLSRQTLSALSEPARSVKEQLFRLKQARDEGIRDKKEAERLEAKLRETLDHADASHLQEAMKRQGGAIAAIRQGIQIEEHLAKLKRHYKDLEKETLDLATDEALPIERTILLAVPFLLGGAALIYGMIHVLGIEALLINQSNPNTGMIAIMFGALCLGLWYLGRERGDRGTSMDLEDCERQIEMLRRQIREVESERDEVLRSLPQGAGSLEQRLREAEELLEQLEAMLPTYHSHLAAAERYKTSRGRAAAAAEALKTARAQWQRTLEQLGLSASLSPSSVRKLSEGYETLLTSRRRLEQLESERDQRLRELAALAKRIESLYLEAVAPDAEPAEGADSAAPRRGKQRHDSDDDLEGELSEAAAAAQRTAGPLRKDPLGQLNQLNEELARQQHWIKRRRELVEQDHQYKRQQAALLRAAERLDQNRRSLWAKCGVATPEQFYALVDRKTQLAAMRSKLQELDKQVRTIVGNHADMDDVARELEGAIDNDLERRWDSLTQRMTQAQQRIDGLRTRQGELAQEMKQLAEDDRLSVAQLELGCTERQIESLARRWQVMAITSNLLEDVCRTVESERQPETLREASSFLGQLTDGKYTRIWTPLGTNQLKIDAHDGGSLPLDVLSRGTREAVFIALRLSLAAAYARRGVMLPLVLDDVLVNFDHRRAVHAAKTLQTFAELGHQVMMFTCHEHITRIFQEIGVQVRLLPEQGKPGAATVMPPPQPADRPQPVAAEDVDDDEPEAVDADDERDADEADDLLQDQQQPAVSSSMQSQQTTLAHVPQTEPEDDLDAGEPEDELQESEHEVDQQQTDGDQQETDDPYELQPELELAPETELPLESVLELQIESDADGLDESDDEGPVQAEAQPAAKPAEGERGPRKPLAPPPPSRRRAPEPVIDRLWYEQDADQPAPADVWDRPDAWWNAEQKVTGRGVGS